MVELLAEPVEILLEPGLRMLAADVAQMGQEFPVGVELAGDAQLSHHLLGRDAVDEHVAEPVAIDPAVLDQLGDEADRPHLAHQRRVEADLVDAVHDLGGRARQLLALDAD